MMLSASGGALLGDIKAMGVSGRGFTPEELAEIALDRIISISSSADPVIRQQAEAFREHIRMVLVSYGNQCVRSNHTTITNRLRDAGHPELTKLLEK
jgi:hypothetical protein